eukprot:SAG22_NODE_7362_length_747_cov_1.214506_1_plen_209_part_10
MLAGGAMEAFKLLLLLLLLTPGPPRGAAAAPRPSLPRRWALPAFEAGWPTSAAAPNCPCADDRDLCKPMAAPPPSPGSPPPEQRVFAFFVSRGSNDTSWRQYDRAQLSTVCLFGSLDPELLCVAHAHGVRIVHGNGGITSPENWGNAAVVDSWVNSTVSATLATFTDGTILDMEVPTDDSAHTAALTVLAKKVTDAMHAAVPKSQVSYD